ncbi:hypothetical protein N322_07196, partial [Cariama cristata]
GITILPYAELWFDCSSITRAVLAGTGVVPTAERCCEPGVSLTLLLEFVRSSEHPLSPPPSRYPFPLKGIISCIPYTCVFPTK